MATYSLGNWVIHVQCFRAIYSVIAETVIPLSFDVFSVLLTSS